MRALCLLRDGPVYRRERFHAGLQRAGFTLCRQIADPGPPDLLVCWNRYGHGDDEARRFERAGARVLVAENSYLAGVGPKAHALALGYHNDSTVIRDDGPERWAALGIPLQPWRADGGHIVVCPNRSFGTPGRIMPEQWGERTRDALQKMTRREVRLRPHPGNVPPVKPLAEDLAGAWCVVIWSSSAGVHALLAGIPVICMAPFWIGRSGAAGGGSAEIESPPMPDRLPVMQRLAWAISTVEEIQSGEAFRRLLA